MIFMPYLADPAHPDGGAVLRRDRDRPSIIVSRVLIAEEMTDPQQVAVALNQAYEAGRRDQMADIRAVLGIPA